MKKEIPSKIRRQIADSAPFEITLSNVKMWLDKAEDNPIKKIIKDKHPLFVMFSLKNTLIYPPSIKV